MKEQSEAGRPFFAYLPFYSVHVPLMAPDDLVEKYKNRDLPEDLFRGNVFRKDYKTVQNNPVVAAMVEAMDQAVGKVLAGLSELGLNDDTIVIFTSDNGGVVGIGNNEPFRAGKGFLYEGGIREPFFVRWPGVTPVAVGCAEPVTGADIYPTLLEAASKAAQPR